MNTFQCDTCGETHPIDQKNIDKYGNAICNICLEELLREDNTGEDEYNKEDYEYIHADQEYDYKRLTGYV